MPNPTSNAKEIYSRGSSETILEQADLAVLRQGSVEDLLDRLRQQVGRWLIAPEDLFPWPRECFLSASK